MSTVTTKKLGTTGLNLMEYLPTGYDPKKAYPCLCFLPGAGEIGSNAALLTAHGPFQYLKSGVDLGLDIIVLAIQNVNQNPRPVEVDIYVNAIKSLYNISALIGTGLSRGGQDWEWYVNNADSQLSKVSALVLFSSEGTVSDMPGISGTYTPSLFVNHGVKFWWGCGTQDSFYDANKTKYKALAGLAPQLAAWTEWAGIGHGDPVWSDGYNPAWTKNELGMSIYTWAANIAKVVAAPPVNLPPVIAPPVVTQPKTIKSVTVNYSDGSSLQLP